MIVTLLLGGNLGDRLEYLKFGKYLIEKNIGIIINKSQIYESEAWGDKTNKKFLNQVIEIETSLEPNIILNKLLNIEQKAGRKRIVKWGARTLDLDILFIESKIIDEEELTVPHPQIQNRRFTLLPLYEIKPNFIHPVLKKKISKLLDICNDNLSVNVYKQ